MRASRGWGALASLLLLMLLAMQGARILSATNKGESSPFFSANDRSRWCTVAALVEDGCYEIDRVIEIRDQAGKRHWTTIDMVRHNGKDGEPHFYSSKPPLLSVLVAGVYWASKLVHGRLLTEHPFYVGRLLLLLVNGIPFIAYGWWCRSWIQRECRGWWSRTLLLLFAVSGTLVTCFVNTLSNHLHGAMAVALSLAAVQAIRQYQGAWGMRPRGWLVVAGMATAFAASCDLPALSWVFVLGGWIGLAFGIRVIGWYVLGIAPVALAFAITNYQAHGEWTPAYAHRGIGAEIATVPKTEGESQPDLERCLVALREAGSEVDGLTQLQPAGRLPCFELSDANRRQRYAVVEKDRVWSVCGWDDWYDYPGSYWLRGKPAGVDQGEPSKIRYAFHAILGHHGILSLTPMWFLGLWGAVLILREGDRVTRLWWLGVIVVTITCMLFYLTRPEIDRNYGGVSCGFRWAVWMIPLWLGALPQALNRMREHWVGRRAAELLLMLSLVSVFFSWANPWTHPWLFQWWTELGWIQY